MRNGLETVAFLYILTFLIPQRSPLCRESGDVVTLFLVVEEFGAAVFLYLFQRGVLSREDIVDRALAGNVLNLTTRKVEVGSQLLGIFVAEVLQHGTPYQAFHHGVGLMELNLEDKATLEGAVEVVRQVGGSDENALEVFNLLQDDVLHGIVHLLNRGINTPKGATLAEDTIGLVEEEDGFHLAVAAEEAR